MSRGFQRTIFRRTPDGWRATRMCEDQELYHSDGKTWDEARRKLLQYEIPSLVAKAFGSRGTPKVKAEKQIP